MKIKILIIISAFCLLSGCASLVLPYRDEAACKKGITEGYCGSITEVYDLTTEQIEKNTNKETKRRGE